MTELLDLTTIPPDLVRRMLEVGEVEWGTGRAKSDLSHVADYTEVLRLTREVHNIASETEMNVVRTQGGQALCMTGNGPNGGVNARLIVGIWNSILRQLRVMHSAESDPR